MILWRVINSISALPEGLAAMVTLLESNPTGVDPLSWLVYNAGAFGIVFLMFATGQVYSKKTVDRIIATLEVAGTSQEAENQWLRDQVIQRDKILEGFRLQLMGQTIPAINQTARVFEQLPAGSEGLMTLLKDTHDRLLEMSENMSRLKGDDLNDGNK